MLVDWEWMLAAAIFAVPLVLFGLFELVAFSRRRREKRIAQRSKGGQRPGRRPAN